MWSAEGGEEPLPGLGGAGRAGITVDPDPITRAFRGDSRLGDEPGTAQPPVELGTRVLGPATPGPQQGCARRAGHGQGLDAPLGLGAIQVAQYPAREHDLGRGRVRPGADLPGVGEPDLHRS